MHCNIFSIFNHLCVPDYYELFNSDYFQNAYNYVSFLEKNLTKWGILNSPDRLRLLILLDIPCFVFMKRGIRYMVYFYSNCWHVGNVLVSDVWFHDMVYNNLTWTLPVLKYFVHMKLLAEHWAREVTTCKFRNMSNLNSL